uniref:Olfactory receptor n=1 Tax=Leptobrachium leishanense TaxID=445787 RepID=A0A8C5M4I1_9ANUR
METGNRSVVTQFILLGLSSDPNIQILLSLVFLLFYITAFATNSLLILAVSFNHHLHNSMYFFLICLSLINLCSPSITIPKMLESSLSGKNTITLGGCTAQIFFYLFLGESECILLAFMAYDRFVAICKPLRYLMIINRAACIRMISATWTVSGLMTALGLFFVRSVTFCSPNIINHFLCEIPSLMLLSCGKTSALDVLTMITTFMLLLIPLTLILFSYFRIIISVTKIQSGRYKAFSTCSSHLIVVTLFYGTAMLLYMRPRGSTADNMDKIVSVFYTAITPMLNPLIYSLRNKDVLRAMRRLPSLLLSCCQ